MSFFEKDELRLLWPFYLALTIPVALFILPIFIIIYFQEINLSFTQIGLLLTIGSISSLIFEVPTGAVADIWGRKISVIIGYLIGGLAVTSLYFTKSYLSILILYFLWYFGTTFISGAYDSWIVDNLKFYKKEKLIKSFYVKRQVIVNASFVIAGILATFLAKSFGTSIIWPVSGISFMITALILSFIKEEILPHKKEAKSFKGFISQNIKSLKYALNHKVVFYILITSLILGISWFMRSDVMINPLLKERGMPIYWLGYLFSISTLIGVFVPYIAHRVLKKYKKESIYLGYLLIIDAIIAISVIFSTGWLAVALIYIGIMAIWDIRGPISGHYLQRSIPSKQRATITSLNSLLVSLGFAIAGITTGLLADNIGIEYTIAIGGVITIFAGIVYLRIKE